MLFKATDAPERVQGVKQPVMQPLASPDAQILLETTEVLVEKVLEKVQTHKISCRNSNCTLSNSCTLSNNCTPNRPHENLIAHVQLLERIRVSVSHRFLQCLTHQLKKPVQYIMWANLMLLYLEANARVHFTHRKCF